MGIGLLYYRKLRNFSRFLRGNLIYVGFLIISLALTSIIVLQTDIPSRYVSYDMDDMDSERDWVFQKGCLDTEDYLRKDDYHKMNATFVVLARNEDLNDMLSTIKSIESHFNQWFGYPYVFLNNEPFSEEFLAKIKESTDATVEFGLIDKSIWEFPEDVRNSEQFKQSLLNQEDRGIIYGGQESYHKMCRFYSGFFYKHPLITKYKWYWRLEPDVEFFCDLTYDPFFEMEKANKKYAFTVMIPELFDTVPNLFRYTKLFVKQNKLKVGSLWKLFVHNYKIIDEKKYEDYDDFINHPDDISIKVPQENYIEYLFREDRHDKDGLKHLINRAKSIKPIQEEKVDNQGFNLCHFWSNFEIARLDIYQNDIYNGYFQFLESNDGFWKERWGDAPVHSLGISLTLDFEDVHYFRDIGYRHGELQHCPKNYVNAQGHGQLPYKSKNNQFKRSLFDNLYDQGHSNGNSCRCKCPKILDVEDTAYYCMYKWFEMSFAKPHDLNLGSKSVSNGVEYNPIIDVEQESLVGLREIYKYKKKEFPKDLESKIREPNE